jgi:phenylpropionate dioxygenase-like ring-hydroxylating dioxygenase large terminal subunit
MPGAANTPDEEGRVLKKDINEKLARVGRGTPTGEMLRRYWQPVGLSKDVPAGGQPKFVRVLGEDLVLIRDQAGRPGLMGARCPHRRAPLTYGRVEDGGLRCAFHGWVWDVNGRCLEQPAEQEHSTYKDKVVNQAYPCEELGGLVFAYMGPPDQKPLLPRYEALVSEAGTRSVDRYPAKGNYLQHLEGAVDTVHFSYLHAKNWSKVKSELLQMPKPRLSYWETDFGLWQESYLPNPFELVMQTIYTGFFMPAGFLRIQEPVPGSGMFQTFQSWYVPEDDTHVMRYIAGFSPPDAQGNPWKWKEAAYELPSESNDYFRNYDEVDTLTGIPSDAPASWLQGFTPQDSVINELQGDIVDRTLEHLGATDAVLVKMRKVMLEAIDMVERGQRPKHIITDPGENEMVLMRAPKAVAPERVVGADLESAARAR